MCDRAFRRQRHGLLPGACNLNIKGERTERDVEKLESTEQEKKIKIVGLGTLGGDR